MGPQADRRGGHERAELDSRAAAGRARHRGHQGADGDQPERERHRDDLDRAQRGGDDQPDNPGSHRSAPQADASVLNIL
jgi:hypothetical protein